MKRIKLGLRHKSVPEKIQKARTVVSRMDGNPHFPGPNPALAELSTAAADLENAYKDAQDGSKSARLRLHHCDAVLDTMIRIVAAYVQSASNGDESIIVSSGFEACRDTTTAVPAVNPSGVRGRATIHEGEVLLRWNRALGARSYVAEMSVDGVTWIACGVSTKTRLIVSNLVGGSKPQFRIAAVGPMGQSGWSDPGAVRVD